MSNRKSFKPSRGMQSARRRRSRPQHDRVRWPFSIHKRAIERLAAAIRTGLGLHCVFHGGVLWLGMKTLLAGQQDAVIKLEASLPLRGRRWIPDLTVRHKKTDKLLLAIEVWHTHAVSPIKRANYNAAGIPWIEIRAWNVLERLGTKNLSVLDWGGIAGLESPFQSELFQALAPVTANLKEPRRATFAVRSKHWPMPQPTNLGFGRSLGGGPTAIG